MYQNQKNVRFALSAKDAAMILSAIDAYSHNLEYRGLLDRLRSQAQCGDVLNIPTCAQHPQESCL